MLDSPAVSIISDAGAAVNLAVSQVLPTCNRAHCFAHLVNKDITSKHFSSRELCSRFIGDIKRVARSRNDNVFSQGLTILLDKYVELGEHDAVAWFKKYHVLKNGRWYIGATPVGVTTSISGQEGN